MFCGTQIKAHSMLKGWVFLPPEECDLQGFIDPFRYIQTSFPRVMVCGRSPKTILLLLFFTRMVLFCSSNCGSDPSFTCEEKWTAHATKSLQPTRYSPRPSKNSFSVLCNTPDHGTEVPLPPCQSQDQASHVHQSLQCG